MTDRWFYHEKHAPNGELVRGVTEDEIKKREKAGWVDTPAKFKKDHEVDPTASASAPVEQPHAEPMHKLEDLDEGALLVELDDMGRSLVEQHIEARGIDRGNATTTAQLRGLLAAHVKPGIQFPGSNSELEISPAPVIDKPALAPEDVVGLENLRALPTEARNARIDGLTDAQIDQLLVDAKVKVKANATSESKRSAVKAYF